MSDWAQRVRAEIARKRTLWQTRRAARLQPEAEETYGAQYEAVPEEEYVVAGAPQVLVARATKRPGAKTHARGPAVQAPVRIDWWTWAEQFWGRPQVLSGYRYTLAIAGYGVLASTLNTARTFSARALAEMWTPIIIQHGAVYPVVIIEAAAHHTGTSTQALCVGVTPMRRRTQG